ncbi:hypothetical protein PM082_023830 [Marasmius tenuissimus]|nr:hypothetical protein PM082_023830 [Marasmius tenuissimus]
MQFSGSFRCLSTKPRILPITVKQANPHRTKPSIEAHGRIKRTHFGTSSSHPQRTSLETLIIFFFINKLASLFIATVLLSSSVSAVPLEEREPAPARVASRALITDPCPPHVVCAAN